MTKALAWRSKLATISAVWPASCASSTGLPLRAACWRATISSVMAACSPPITAVRAFGHEKQKRGLKPRPHMPKLPAPNEAPQYSVICGTLELDSAWIILEPCLIMPASSEARPTIKPVVFCRKTIGVPDWLHSWMNCAALVAPAGSIGPLLVMKPTVWPSMRAWPHTVPGP